MGVSTQVVRTWLALLLVVCASCAHPPVKGRVTEPAPGKSVGRPGCGPPITYQIFRRDAFGADWSKTRNLLAYNAKGTDGAYHIYTVKPDGVDAVQLGAGSASFPQRSTGTPVWSPSGAFIAFVAEKSNHPGSSVTATPGWGSYSDLWVANADGSRAWQLTDVATDKDHGTIIPEFSPRRAAARVDRAHQGRQGARQESVRRVLGDQGSQLRCRPGWHAGSVERTDRVTDRPDAFNETGGFSADSSSLVFTSDFETHNFWSNQIYRYDLNSGATSSTYARQQLQRASPLHPGWPGAVDDQRRQPVTRHRLVDDEP